MDMKDFRAQIDEIDSGIIDLITRRFAVVRDIAAYKAKNNVPIYDPARERQKLNDLANSVGEELAPAMDALFSLIFDLSRSEQHRIFSGPSPIKAAIQLAMANTPAQFPLRPLVACQGVEGAYSQMACERLFPSGSIMYFSYFENVCSAVEQGLCRYGILPIENSTAGSVTQVYDLMADHKFYIARDYKLKINHQLLVKSGTKLEDIKEIYSHNQAIGQCSQFLKEHSDIKINIVQNTAVAARMIADSDRNDIAAISSSDCRQLYGLDSIPVRIQNTDHNYTRFICITKELRIYPGASKTSIMLALGHRPGALADTLAKFASLELNLTKIESRPIAGSDFEFMFYLDFEASVYSEEVVKLLCQLDSEQSDFAYLGTYI